MFEITFLANGKVEKHYTRDYDRYVLSDETYVDVITAFFWCNRCGKVIQGELVESLEALDTAIANLSNPESAAYQYYATMYRRKKDRDRAILPYKSMLVDRKRWLVNRASPARCLTCGTVDLISLKSSDEIETDAGKITIRFRVFASLAYNPRYFSPEGDLIEHTPPPKKVTLPERKWWQLWR